MAPKRVGSEVRKASLTATYDAEVDEKAIAYATNYIAGLMAAPASIGLQEAISCFWMPVLTFMGFLLGVFIGTFLGGAFKAFTFKACVAKATMAILVFSYAGSIPLTAGLLLPTRAARIFILILSTGMQSAGALMELGDEPRRKLKIHPLILWIIIMVSMVAIVGLPKLKSILIGS